MSDSELAQELVDSILEELENDTLELPSLPEVALRVKDEVESEQGDAQRIAQIISHDAALSTRLIQVANSSLLRGNRQVDSIERAVTRMGNNLVKNVVMGLIVKQIFQPTTELSDKMFRQFWQHSALVAAYSHALATQVRINSDQALLAGLVHDIGVLPVIKKAEDIESLYDNEPLLQAILTQTHTTIGSKILSKWAFPHNLVEVAAEHEQLDRDPPGDPDLVDVVIVANLQSYQGEYHSHASVDWERVPAFRRLGLDPSAPVFGEGAQVPGVEQLLDGFAA